MTKPDFNTSKPKTQEQAAQAAPPETTVDDKKDTKKQNKPQKKRKNFQERRIEDIMAAIGMDVCSDNNDLPGPRHIGMEWAFILRVANTQAVLSVLSIVCLSSSMLLTGFNFYRFTSSAWATYLLSCAYIGMRAGRWQSYAHVVAFCGMCTFQTLIYMSTMCWLVYSVYALDAHSQIYDPGSERMLELRFIATLNALRNANFHIQQPHKLEHFIALDSLQLQRFPIIVPFPAVLYISNFVKVKRN
ncbi:unnamed protein product [Toxocara canis]|uniref:Transmembrane protein n=1 Tax=Toxocara canis TaxID=6265 RepID=A0A183TX36_TOXCA|nr:unnamed protein product [Toxocara canis]